MGFIWFVLSEHNERSPTRLDWTGFLTFSVALIAAQFISTAAKAGLVQVARMVLARRGRRASLFRSSWPTASPRTTLSRPASLLLNRNFTIGLISPS